MFVSLSEACRPIDVSFIDLDSVVTYFCWADGANHTSRGGSFLNGSVLMPGVGDHKCCLYLAPGARLLCFELVG